MKILILHQIDLADTADSTFSLWLKSQWMNWTIIKVGIAMQVNIQEGKQLGLHHQTGKKMAIILQSLLLMDCMPCNGYWWPRKFHHGMQWHWLWFDGHCIPWMAMFLSVRWCYYMKTKIWGEAKFYKYEEKL